MLQKALYVELDCPTDRFWNDLSQSLVALGKIFMDFGGLKVTFGMIWCLWSSFGEDFGDERHQDQIFGRQERGKERKMKQLGRVWEHLGSILDRHRGFLGGSWSVQRVPGGCLGRSFRSLKGILCRHCIFLRFYHDFF